MNIPMRYLYTVLGFVGMLFTFALKTNMNIAIVSMVNHTAIKMPRNRSSITAYPQHGLVAPALSNSDNTTGSVPDGPMIWSMQLQGVIISSYFWGYLVGQIPGGMIAQQYSAKWAFYAGVSVQGVTAGFIFPASHTLLSKWAPVPERNIIGSCIFSGSSIGVVISLLLIGQISHGVNWEASFYITGVMGTPWMILWPILVTDSPKTHKLIKEKELDYIVANTRVSGEKLKVPWRKIFGCGVFWLVTLTQTTSAWCWYVALTELPIYMDMILKFSINENGLAASMPFLGLFLGAVGFGKFTDYLIANNKMSVTLARKFCTAFTSLGPALCFSIIIFVTDRILVVVLMVFSMIFFSSAFSGILQVHLDIAPNFAGTLMAVANTFASIPGIIIPLFIGWITERDPSAHSWQIVFLITIGICLFQFAVFTIFYNSKELEWNTVQDSQTSGETKAE